MADPRAPALLLPRAPWARWLPWCCGLVAATLAAKNLIGTYADLGIYLDVAREFCAGGHDLTRARPDSGPWVYPHVAALPFAALLWLFGDDGARWAWCLLLGVATGWLLRDLGRLLGAVGGLAPWQWVVFGVLFQRCIAQNLTHGQLSLWVGTFVTAGALALVRGHGGRAGVCLGLAAALKVTPLLFLPALPLMRCGRAAAAMAGTVAAVVLLLPWPFCGTAEHLRHLGDFWHAATGSVLRPESAAIVQSYAGPSIAGTLDYLLQARAFDREGRTVHVLDLGDGALLAVKVAWAALLGSLLLAWFVRARRAPEPRRLAEQAAAVMMAMALFAPLVRVYHLAAALVPFALFCRGPAAGRGRRDLLWAATALAFLFALTLRQKKLLGETLWRAFDVGGLLHAALVGLLVWSLRHMWAATAPARP